MRIGIGIDTGGTCTDAVIYDFLKKKILSSAKVLTTKEDLSVGIGNALDLLDQELLPEAEMVSLSTTLATNACVEDKGGRAKLLFIGVNQKAAADVGGTYGLADMDRIYFLDAETSLDGKILKKPNWEIFLEESRDWFLDAEGLGIVERDAMDNGGILEKEAKTIIEREYGIPVICGQDLFSDLNSIKRGSSILLNARLIPVISEFLTAIKTALGTRGVSAPVAIVRSDGSLMSESFTGVRPVETLLCGPASSVVGGNALAGEKESLIIDMGGTTTDIAIIRNGAPVRAKDGINVGQWRTFVKGIYVETFGLGGDSVVRFDKYGNFRLEVTRVIPLSVAAARWPEICESLKRLIASLEKHTQPLHEFFTLVKDIENNPYFTKTEKDFCAALKDGPLTFSDAAAAIGKDAYNLNVGRLERESIVMRCGLTPTDIMHLKGDFCGYCTEAARLGAQFVANAIGVSVSELSEMVYDSVKKRLYYNIVRILLMESRPELRKKGIDKSLESLILSSWEMSVRNGSSLSLSFSTPSVLVGIGAPIHIFLPDVSRALGTRCVIPEQAGVVNALGAVAGNVAADCAITIKPRYEGGYTVYGNARSYNVDELEEANSIALEEAEKGAREEAARRGASGEMVVNTGIFPKTVITNYNTEIFLESRAIATAIGGIGL